MSDCFLPGTLPPHPFDKSRKVSTTWPDGHAGLPKGHSTLGDVESFVHAGKLDMERALDVMQACIKFFIMGWHARGAIEDTEKLKQIVRTA
jgi:hypothetical protein